MSANSLTGRRRALALAGVAIISLPMIIAPIVKSSQAHAGAFLSPASATEVLAPAASFSKIVAADKPAVVTVMTKIKHRASMNEGFGGPVRPQPPMDDFFRRFFGENGPMPPAPQGRQDEGGQPTEALGSGFIIDPSGTIVTNNHVIDGASEITVTLDDGTTLPAQLVGHDAKTDLAVLKIKADKPLPVVTWGDSDKLSLGDPVLAIGNPFGIGTTVTAGIVSARGRDLHSGPYDDFIQVDAAINHGNSGGPLVDMEGQVVGITSAIYSPNGGSVGVGFAIPSDQAEKIVGKLIANGTIDRGFIGVEIQPVTGDVADAMGLEHASGALVASVNAGSPAAKAGLKPGDIVSELDGKPAATPKDISRMIADTAPGSVHNLKVWRDGMSIDVAITVGRSEENRQLAMKDSENKPQSSDNSAAVPSIGLDLTDLSPEARQYFGIPEEEVGALVDDVTPDKGAADRGIRQGDVIVSVNQTDVTTAQDAVKAIADAGKSGRNSVLLRIDRQGNLMFIAVPFGKA